MIFDLNAIADNARLDTDLCIVGAGAAGISMAMALADAGIDIVLVESGGLEPDDATQALAGGEVAGLPYHDLDTARLRGFGGTTGHWAGQSCPMQPIDFEARPWIRDSGWPIAFSELADFLPSAAEICKLTGTGQGAPWHLGTSHPVFPLTGTGFGPQIFRFPEPVTRFGEDYRQVIETATGIRCYLNANVTGLETDTSGRRVESVELRSLGGKTVRLAARYIVLAAGGIENSRLLLLSGLGNDHEQVGRYFMEHPNYDSGEVVLFSRDDYLSEAYRDIGQEELRFDFQLLPQVQERLGLLNHSAFLVPASKTQSRLARAWARVRGQWNDVDQRTFALRIRLEHAPDPESRVTLSDETDALGQPRARLDMRFGSLEGRTILAVNEAFARALGMTGLGRMKVDFDLVGDWPNRVGWQYHHYGGTRMHDDQKKGVVDRDCRVHGTVNLYVAGSSVFPTCGHSNPTMNLIALSLRLAAHLKDKAAP